MFKNKRQNRIVRIVSLLVSLAVMGVIFFMSSQNGSSSDRLSISFTSLLFSREWDAAAILNILTRKFAHITEFAALAVPLYFFFSTFKIKVSARCAVPFCLTAVYAVSDEIHQLFVEGRACLVSDMVIDSLGALLAIYILNLIVRKVTFKNKESKIIDTTVADSVFNIACAFMYGKKANIMVPDDKFNEFTSKLREHKLLPVASFSLNENTGISDLNRKALKKEAFGQIIGQENKNAAFLTAYKAMTDAGAKPICIKGCICAGLWSEPSLRISGDADILAAGDDFRICSDILKSLGYTSSESNSSNEVCFYNNKNGSRIELHSSLFAKDSPASDFNSVVGDLSINPLTVTIDGVDVFCPYAQDHLVYLILHAFRHFINSGVGIRQLMDISLFCKDESIDWNIVFEKCSQVAADGFLSAVLLICSKYFGLDINRIDSSSFNCSLDCELLLKDIKSGGIYGPADMDKHHSGRITLNNYDSSQNGKHNSVIFLPLEKMKKRYSYLCRFPFLLPVAWLQRVFSYLLSDHNVSDTLASGRSRTQIMKYYGIIK